MTIPSAGPLRFATSKEMEPRVLRPTVLAVLAIIRRSAVATLEAPR